ncbi:type II secretion system F family protein [Aliidiomarina indica]|uniref:type II secretion system F family protein n=1 Tax=Aliidiomarina indica TaxID=2749147 RepID=UPI001890B1E1|nr:type II secretion system F family protein [Aliidiomarina indica]
MAEFRYQGRDRQGKTVRGLLQGPDEAAIAQQLIRKGIVPQQIKSSSEGSSGIDLKALFTFPVPLPELIMFIRQMYSLTKAGIPMLRAIEGLATNATHKRLQRALLDMADQLERGRGLSTAMADHPKVFPRVVVAVVNVGENTGRLEESFAQLAAYLESELDTRKRIKQATRYPSFVLGFLVIAVTALNILVIPRFAEMFSGYGVELPVVTQILIGSSNFFVNYWWTLVIGTLFCIFGLVFWLNQPGSRERWDRLKIKLPAVGDIIERSLLGRFCRSFSVMLNAGVPLTQALSMVSDALDNQYMAVRVSEMRRGIERGDSLLKVARQSKLFSPLVLQMIAVGEETGSLDALLDEAAEYYEREVDYDLKTVTARIEPILISFVAGLVLLLAMGIFLPMWNMMGAYSGGL